MVFRLVVEADSVEELVEKVAERLGYAKFTVRNLAILYGLQLIAVYNARIPETDEEFMEVIDATRNVLREHGYA